MRKVANKSVLIMLVILFTLSSLSISTFAIEKKDEKGEILNLPPFVDFEVKEKRKVDVIVDVGNTNYSVEQVNSLVNEKLRPQLQENGIDYKIHVEKSSERSSRIYYFSASGNSGLYYYDVVTRENVFVQNTAITGQASGVNSVYDPDTELIFTADNGNYVVSTNSRDTFYNIGRIQFCFYGQVGGGCAGSTSGYQVDITSEGYVVYETGSLDDYYTAAIDINDIVTMKNTTEQLRFSLGRKTSDKLYPRFMAGLNNSLLSNSSSSTSLSILKNPSDYLKSVPDLYYDIKNSPNIDRELIQQAVGNFDNSYGYSKETGEIMFASPDYMNDGKTIKSYTTKIYDPKTKQTRIFEDSTKTTPPQIYFLEGKELLYRSSMDGKYYYYEDYMDTTKRREVSFLTISTGMPKTHIGEVIALGGNSSKKALSFINVITGETLITLNANDYYSAVRYPKWYTSKQRRIIDILEEVPYRADAEKYYIRLDDYSIPHLDRESTLGQTVTQLSKQQIDYVSIGNTNNEVVTKKLQTALGSTQRYNISEIQTAFGQIGSYITDRKEVDLHILMAKTGVTEASITAAIKDLTSQLQKENIVVTPQYVKGTDNSTLYELLNQVNWRDDRNNYVLFLNQGMMSEFNDPLVEEEISLLLKGNYSFFTSMGSTSNKSVNESLIASNNGNGYFFAGTNISYMTGELKKYIAATAVKNPKRVSDTLVLNYDSTTGEYSSDVLINTYYEDFENDRKINERFLTTHDPSVFENNTGVMEGIGQYQESPTTKFTKVGLYEMVVQVQDDPTRDAKFSNYNLWSQDSLSRLVLYVHRAPVAEFSAIVNSSKVLTIKDYSYDLDRYSQRNKGIVSWVWKWKKVNDEDWTVGNPPSQLQANTDYFVSLKVKDIDGAWSSEVVKYVTTNPYNQPPVALFTIDPKSVSWNKQTTITDLSYDPDGDPIITREWKVYRDNQLILSSATTPTITQMKNSASAAGLNILGNYKISLRVQDSQKQWSEWYTDFLEVINFPPVADFEPLADTYRDTTNKVINITANPDQDGDKVTYQWKLYYGDKTYNLGTAEHPSFKVKDLGLGKSAVGTWMLELKASDPLGAFSYMTYSFDVLNQTPTTTITSGRSTGYINEPYAYTSSRSDADTEDTASLQTFWRLTSPSGKVKEWYTQNISITYVEKGSYLLENWVVDQLGAKSDVDNKSITILNQLPIPGFTMKPNPSYRGVDINFVSQATDLDGYIDKTTYYIVNSDGTMSAISGTGDFKRPFSTIGKLTIRQVVVDNDGASAETSKELIIQNRIPVANITSPPATSAATATKMDATPRIEWTYSDADNDVQQRYNVVVRNSSSQQVYATGAVTSNKQAIIIPESANLQENVIYNVSVQVYDGYDWSDWSTLKYFYIVRNKPPEAGFTWSPNSIWEGDSIQIKHQVSDTDDDQLQVQYEVTAPNGVITQYPQADGHYVLTKTHYNSDAFMLNGALPGRYIIEQKVTDNKSDPVTLTQSIIVGELIVSGEVSHTEQWEQYRVSYNQSATSNGQQKWEANQFYAGEKLVLEAITTNTGANANPANGSITYARAVTVSFRSKYETTLQLHGSQNWSGELWHSDFAKLANGPYEVVFSALYSNGVVKQHTVTIQIIGKATSFIGVHRWK